MSCADILIVEDNADDVLVARRAFHAAQLDDRIAVTSACRDALEYLFDGSAPLPRVVLLDLGLPGADGKSLLRCLRSCDRTRNLPVVVVSASEHPDDVADCYRMGANSFVVKRYAGGSPGRYMVDIARYWLNLNRSA